MRPVFIEEVSAICNLGTGWPAIWKRLLAGDRVTTPFELVETRLPIDAEVAGIANLDRSFDPAHTGAGAACRLASKAIQCLSRSASSTIYGATNHGESDVVAEIALARAQGGKPDEALIAALAVDPMPLHIRAMTGGETRVVWSYSACAAGVHALALAAAAVDDGIDEHATVVAADALSALAVAGFSRIGALSSSGAPPLTIESDGILIGEGAAALTLSAVPRPVAILGFGMSCDAGHQIHPDETGTALAEAIRQTLYRSGCAPAEIRGAILHGTGTSASDAVEAAVVTEIFGPDALPVTSLKGLIGHCMGAAGIFNVLAAWSACTEGWLPPVGHATASPREGIDVVLGDARKIPVGGPVLAVASGFGGNHVATVLGDVP